MLYFGAIVLLPQLLQRVYGYRNVWAGLASAPVGIIQYFVADYRTLRINWICAGWSRSASLCTPSVFYWRWTFEPGMVRRFRMAAVYSKVADRLLLYAADHHYALRVTARTAGGGIKPVELHANC